LYLNDGVWKGERILPEGWVHYVSSLSGPQREWPRGYGAGFWLMTRSEGVSPDTFAAFGNRGQYVVIVPSRNVVIVREARIRSARNSILLPSKKTCWRCSIERAD
jgi:CubicO group peptidase (beta-lactamase class C family)